MLKKIRNGWLSHPDYYCFGCCPDNDRGLQMQFYEEGDDIVSHWKPRPEFQGWIGVLHGGIQATLCDEIASWVVFRKLHTTGVTARLEMRYRKPISTSVDHLTLRAHLTDYTHRLAHIEVTIQTPDDEVCVQMNCTYFLVPPQQAQAEGFPAFDLEED